MLPWMRASFGLLDPLIQKPEPLINKNRVGIHNELQKVVIKSACPDTKLDIEYE
jgi:hypothetical protein